jgi:hypothetical protein
VQGGVVRGPLHAALLYVQRVFERAQLVQRDGQFVQCVQRFGLQGQGGLQAGPGQGVLALQRAHLGQLHGRAEVSL